MRKKEILPSATTRMGRRTSAVCLTQYAESNTIWDLRNRDQIGR